MKCPHGVRRRLLQLAAFGFTNPHFGNLFQGKLYQGPWKKFCSPGLNCYSCPAAGFACPIGAMQGVAGAADFRFSFYAAGLLLALGAVMGRWACGFLCPFGLLQELLAKIPGRKFRLPRALTYGKYGVLLLFVLVLPVTATNYLGMGKPAFCEWICPAGTLEAGIPLLLAEPALRQAVGGLFSWKLTVLLGVLAGCLFVPRFFCKTLCPLGAVYGLTNRFSLYRLRVDPACCAACGRCASLCRMDVDPSVTPNSCECIRCGDCAAGCPQGAIRLGFRGEAGPVPDRKK